MNIEALVKPNLEQLKSKQVNRDLKTNETIKKKIQFLNHINILLIGRFICYF